MSVVLDPNAVVPNRIRIKNVTYVANHHCGGNDDEGAIEYALNSLGVNVTRVNERQAHEFKFGPCDFVLFHKWSDYHKMKSIEYPKVFWYFDLVDYPDPSLNSRCFNRITWMAHVLPLVSVGFCTDGDWVASRKHGWRDKLEVLHQGFDCRMAGKVRPGIRREPNMKVLFTGIDRLGGEGRSRWVDMMRGTYNGMFSHVRQGCYRYDLMDLINSSLIYACPDHPITSRYWSNRVYQGCGMGGIVLHKYTAGLEKEFTEGEEILYYANDDELHEHIREVIANPKAYEAVSIASHQRTMKEHRYLDRVEQLLLRVQERLSI